MFALMWLIGTTAAPASEWPQWFGPHRDGSSDEEGILAGWMDGVDELWRVELGAGYSSVAVSNGAVYAMTVRDGEEQVVALDAATGVERWRSRVGPEWVGNGYPGPRSTPTVVGDQVIAYGVHGGLVSVDRTTGARQWAVDVGNTYDGTAPSWGYSSSPLVDDGRIYLTTGNTDGRAIVSLSLADGSLVWAAGSYTAGYSSPVRASLGGVDQVVVFTGTAAVGMSLDGKELWSHPWSTSYDINAATPLPIGSNRLFVASGYGVGGATLLIDEQMSVMELWRTKKMKNKTATSVLADGVLYGFNESELTAVDATTGKPHWSEGDYGRGSLILADGHLVVLSEQCDLRLVKASPTGHEAVGSVVHIGDAGPCWTAPALSQGVIYARDGAQLVAVAVRSAGPVQAHVPAGPHSTVAPPTVEGPIAPPEDAPTQAQ